MHSVTKTLHCTTSTTISQWIWSQIFTFCRVLWLFCYIFLYVLCGNSTGYLNFPRINKVPTVSISIYQVCTGCSKNTGGCLPLLFGNWQSWPHFPWMRKDSANTVGDHAVQAERSLHPPLNLCLHLHVPHLFLKFVVPASVLGVKQWYTNTLMPHIWYEEGHSDQNLTDSHLL